MNIVKYDPFRSFLSWPKWDDFDDSFQKGLKVKESGNSIIAEAVVAGVPAKDVEINIEDGILTIKAKKTDEKEEKNEYKSSSYQYYYTCALSGGRWNKAEAEIEDGVVKITIPKEEVARPRKITVKAKAKK